MILVRNTEPFHTEKNVNRDSKIYVRFFSDMKEDTFTRNNVVLFNVSDQKTEAVHLKYRQQILTIEPVELLAPKAHYRIMITGGELGVRDIVDTPMAESFTMEFYTKEVESLKPPAIIEPNHRTIIDMPTKIKINGFKEAAYIRLQLSDTHDFNRILYPINEQLFASQEYVEITPDIQLPKGTYYLRVASLNEKLEQSEFGAAIQFYTEGNLTEEPAPEPEPEPPTDPPVENPDEEEGSIEDNINEQLPPPDITEEEEELLFKVLGLSPKKDMVHVPISQMKTIVLRFNEDIDPASVTNETVYVVAEKN